MNAKTSDSPMWQHFKRILLWVALIGIVMLPRVLNLDTFIGPDERILWGWGNHFAFALSRGDWRDTLVGDGYPAVTLMWINTVGVAFKWLWLNIRGANLPFEAAVGLDRPLELYAERRLFLSVFNGLQILAAYPLLRRVWDQYVAAIAVGLMAIEPLALTFTRMVRADALLSGFMVLSILSSLTFLKTGDRRYNWLAGAMGGLAALSKLSGGIMALVVLAIYGAVAWHRSQQAGWARPLRWLGGAVLSWGIPAAVVFFGLWPAWWVRPVDTFNLLWGSAVYYTAEVTTTRAGSFFWGALRPLGAGPTFYWVLAALRLTPWLLAGSLIAIGHRLWRLWRGNTGPGDGYVWAIVFYVATYWTMINLISLKPDRYFLPIIPGLAVLTSIAVAEAARWATGRLPQQAVASLLSGGLAFGGGLLVVAHVAAYHPFYSTYFDPLVGNPRWVQWALPVGQGEGVDAALKYFSSLPGAAESVVVCGTNFPRCRPFFAGELWHQEDLRSNRWFEADYALLHIDEQQVGVYPEGVLTFLRRQPPVYVASYHGIDYTWLYAIPQPPFHTGGSKLEGVATLLGYDVAEKSLEGLSPGDQIRLHVYWQNEGQASQQQFWWRVVDGEGYVWNEETAQPLAEFEAVAAQDGAIVEGQVALSLPPDMPPGTYSLKTGFADARGDVGQFALPTEGSVLQITGAPLGETRPSHSLDEALTSDLRLRGYDLSRPESVPGETLWLALYWQAIGQPQRDYVINLGLLDEVGGEVTSWSGRPVHNTFPTRQWAANAHVRDPWRITLPSDLAPGRYQFSLSLRDASGSAELAQADLASIQVVERRTSFDIPPMQFEAGQSFGDIATLLGYDLSGDLAPDGAHLSVTLYWRAMRTTDQAYTVNVRLVDANGLVLAEQESAPGGGVVSTTGWQVGEIITDLHPIDVARSEPASVNLEVRLWDASGRSVPTQSGTEAWIVSDVQQKVMWRTSLP